MTDEASGLSIVQEAQKVRDEIRAENDRRERILAEEQKLRAEQMLSGSGAIIPKTLVSEEDLKKQSAIEMFKGTGIEEAIKKHG